MPRKTVAVWTVRAGSLVRHYFTEHHAQQMARALSAAGFLATVRQTTLPDDALTRLSVQP